MPKRHERYVLGADNRYTSNTPGYEAGLACNLKSMQYGDDVEMRAGVATTHTHTILPHMYHILHITSQDT